MKKKIYILLLTVLCIGMQSCSDYLDSDYIFEDRETIEKVFNDRDKTDQWLSTAYSYLKDDCAEVCSKGYVPFCYADDMYYGDRDATYDISNANALSYNKFKEGNYDENTKQGLWTSCYRGIRQASIFIQNVDMSTKFDSEEEKADYKAQARFIRAYYYWMLLRRYGPVPLLPDAGIDYTLEYDEIATPRSSYEACAEYISEEMKLAARDLPLKRGGQTALRPTRGAALAARANVLIYAASPLMNGNDDVYAQQLVDRAGNRLLSKDYSEEKWAKAAAACKDVMELGIYKLYTADVRTTHTIAEPATIAPPYHAEYSEKDYPEGWKNIDPFESYRSVFNGQLNEIDNPELIFTRGQNIGSEDGRAMVLHQLPHAATGWNTHGLTQKMVDMYYMNDGNNCPGMNSEPEYVTAYSNELKDTRGRLTGFTDNDQDYKPLPAGVSLQYANREPRFYASVAYSGSIWHLGKETESYNRDKQCFYYRGGKEGYTNTMFWLRTGIGVMKFVHPDDTGTGASVNNIRFKVEPAMRYADILLLYAEAVNEVSEGTYNIPSWDGATTYIITRDVAEMKKGIKPIRMRAGVPDFNTDVYASKDKFRIYLKRERMIELMGEGKRYYDLRRWKDAPIEESLPVYGCNALMTANEREQFHTPVAIWNLSATFSSKMWFWPISHSELKKNSRLTQNPGWTYND